MIVGEWRDFILKFIQDGLPPSFSQNNYSKYLVCRQLIINCWQGFVSVATVERSARELKVRPGVYFSVIPLWLLLMRLLREGSDDRQGDRKSQTERLLLSLLVTVVTPSGAHSSWNKELLGWCCGIKIFSKVKQCTLIRNNLRETMLSFSLSFIMFWLNIQMFPILEIPLKKTKQRLLLSTTMHNYVLSFLRWFPRPGPAALPPSISTSINSNYHIPSL